MFYTLFVIGKIMGETSIPATPLHILLVEDDEALRGFLKEALEVKGYQVSVAKQGREACYLATEFKPDLVITDIFMPEMDGLVVVQQLSRIPQPPKIIVISGMDPNSHYLNMAEKFGASGVLKKPIKLDDLYKAIEAVLSKN